MNINYSEKLEEFTEFLKKVPEIISIYFTGSTATKSWDEYSDIDICVVIDDKNYNNFIKKIPDLLSKWGKINLCNHYKDIDETYAFIGEDYTKVEIEPIKKSELKKGVKNFNNIRIAFDKDQSLTNTIKKYKIKKSILNHEEIVWFFLYTRSNFIYTARHYARGQKLSGISELGNIGGDLFYYLGKIHGYEGHEFIRNAEKLLTKKEWNFLINSRYNSFEKKELIRCIKSNWQYMKYLEDLYEKNFNKKLNLNCNDKEILNIVFKTLK